MIEPTAADFAKADEVAEASMYRGQEVLKKRIAVALAEAHDLPVTSAQIIAISRWLNAANAHRNTEAQLWSRVLKVTEESGEVYRALSGAIGENPRKGITHSLDDVVDELLDVAAAALCAVEHMDDHRGQALTLLAARIAGTATRAGLKEPS